MNNYLKILLGIFFLALIVSGCAVQSNNTNSTTGTVANQGINTNTATNTDTQSVLNNNTNTAPQPAELVAPIADALSRITKKPFGIYITPKTSPVQPERFTGYHTGVDFETTPAEANIDVPITAACIGKVRIRQRVSGYGGVLIQDCILSGAPVTVLYGHLNLDSITVKVGQTLAQRDFIGNLGQGYSTQTDGERKHLHLSVHKGTAINYKGYVSTESQLSDWLDPQRLF